jgi:hypothetical protein
MHAEFNDRVSLRATDFRLPDIPELPSGLLTLANVTLWPGVNGLHDSAGLPIPETCVRRGFALDHFPHGRPEPLDATQRGLAFAAEPFERIVYLPYARMVHFGHLLTEFAGHAGSLLEHPRGLDGIGGEGSVLVVSARCESSTAALADLLGLPSDRVFSTASLPAPVRASLALVPRPSMINRHGLNRRHFSHVRSVLDRLHGVGDRLAALTATAGHEKVYLSRSRLPPDARRVRDEDAMEAELERLGWRIVHPQELTVGDQLDRLAAAATVAGCVGSALHLLMAFGEDHGGRRLIALGSGVERTNPNVALQAARQGMPFRHLVCVTDDDEAAPAHTPHRLRFTASPPTIARWLDELASSPLE